MGTAKWRLALWRYHGYVTIWRFEQEREKEKGEAISTTDIAWPARACGPCGRKVAAYFFFTTLGFPAGVFPTFWELVFSRQLLSGVEKACRYVDRTGYQRTTSGLCSKMPPTAIWRLFVHTPIAGATDSDRFSRGWVPLLPRWVFLRWRQGKVKRERLKLLDLKTYCQFCSHKRKTVLLVQSDAGLERKKLSKGVCVRVIAFLPMVPTTNVSKGFKFRVNVDQVRFHGLYRWLCKDFYIEGRLVCLATDINAILYLYLTSLLTLGQVSVTFRQLPNLPVFCGGRGGGVWAKYGHARILVNAEIYGRSLISSFERKSSLESLAQNILEWPTPSHARNLSFTHDGYIRHTATEMIILMTDISAIWHSTG